MQVILTLLSSVVKVVLEWAAPLLLYFKGKRDKEADINEEDAKVLKKQRDSNITSIDDARDFWVRLRNRKNK